jgi:predicted secreted Zn-dependent protease
MCVVSAVMPGFEPVIPYPVPVPAAPTHVATTWPWTTLPNGITLTPEQLGAVLAAFRQAIEAARAADKAAGQPHCDDPEKIKLEARVTELERRLDAMTKAGAHT